MPVLISCVHSNGFIFILYAYINAYKYIGIDKYLLENKNEQNSIKDVHH